ncbi:hypothetical protein QWZ13_00830 [Reinekea marina]|nr:hypothetical protein [Reinekea marina]MDN3647447.1 hypothetical protein [Reinekea marina]
MLSAFASKTESVSLHGLTSVLRCLACSYRFWPYSNFMFKRNRL